MQDTELKLCDVFVEKSIEFANGKLDYNRFAQLTSAVTTIVKKSGQMQRDRMLDYKIAHDIHCNALPVDYKILKNN